MVTVPADFSRSTAVKARELVVNLERGSPLEVEAGALEVMRCPRDLVSYFRDLAPRGRSTNSEEICAEITRALGRNAARAENRLTPLLDPVAPRAQWQKARAQLGIDRWPRLVERPLLGPTHLAVVAIIPIIIFLIALTITEAMVVAVLSGALVTAWIGAFLLNRMNEKRVEVEPSRLTLRELAEQIAVRREELAALPPETFAEETVLQRVRGALGAETDDIDLDRPFED
jgi:hypothetical protein